ncbi:MAG: glycosyltransferase family 39 protein [archaeon]|nr:glycosyltransferase family 39 protein [archaeon]
MVFGSFLPKGDSRLDSRLILGVAAAFVLIQLVFFPHMYLAIDEHEYLKNASLISQGAFGETNPGYACRSNVYNENGYISNYFIGRSLFLLPFLPFGFDAIMLSGTFIHLINLLLIALLLSRLGVRKIYSLLYLFYPVLLWSSRTLYPELLVLTGFLAGTYFYLGQKNRDWVLSGFFFGLSVLARYDAIFGLVAFAIPAFFADRKKFALFLAGAAPIGLLILTFNSVAYSGALNTGYGSGVGLLASVLKGVIDIDHIFYAIILLVFYPLLLASPYLSKGFVLKKEFALLTIFYFVLNAKFTSFLAFDFSLQSAFVARLRYLIPLIGLLMVPYAFLISETLSRKKIELPKKAIYAVIILMLAGAAFASSEHTKLLGTRSGVLDEIRANIPEGSIVIGSSDDCIFFQKNFFGDRKYYNVDLGQDLATNPEKISLESLRGKNTYVLELRYGHRSANTGERQDIVDAERAKMSDFIEANKGSLELIYESSSPNQVAIYRWD